MKKFLSILLSINLVISGLAFTTSKDVGADDEPMYGSLTTNLAQGKNAYASSNDRQDKNYSVKVGNLTDNNTNSYIVTHKNDTSPWFAVDLGSVQEINKIKLVPGGNDAYTSAYPISYEIQVSDIATTLGDNAAGVASINWTTVKTVTDATLSTQEVTFSSSMAKWVRIKVNSQNTSCCSLFELCVYGTDKGEPYIEPGDTSKVLFIGNSMTYYNTLCEVVEGLANHKGKNIDCTAATNGGQNLIYQSTAANVDTAIKLGGYETVVIQDIVGSFDKDNLQTGADALIAKIKQYNPDAHIVFYMPWPTKGTIKNPNSKLPYFTNAYYKTALKKNSSFAPAGEAFYDIYVNSGLDYYCSDGKHPQPLGTFISASTVLYTMFPDLAKADYTSADQSFLDNLINTNVAYTNEGKQTSYDLATLNLINEKGYSYAHAVADAMATNTGYTSAAGEYEDLENVFNPDGLPAVQGTVVDTSLFSTANGDLAIGKTAYVSSTYNSTAANANDGKTNTRWESVHGVDPQWVYLDMGTSAAYDTVGFIWEGAYAKQYVIQVSDDAQNWTTVQYVKATSNKTVQIPLGQTYTNRYVRMTGFSRGTTYGYSFYEMGVWKNSKETFDVKIDNEKVATVEDGSQYTIPSTYELGYYNADDKSKVYKPGTKVAVTSNLNLTSIRTVDVTSSQNGASIKFSKSTPSISFEATAKVNGNKPIFSSAFTYGMAIAPENIYYEYLNEELVPTKDTSKTADIEITDPAGFADADEGLYRCGITNVHQYNLNRNFLARAYVKIKYTDGSSKTIFSNQNSLTRSIAQVANEILQNPEKYNVLIGSEQEAVRYFAGFYE